MKMKEHFFKVDSCENAELRKDSHGNAAIYIAGSLKHSGSEYSVGRKWLDVKASIIHGA